MKFQQKLNSIIEKNNSLLCIGLDSDPLKIPSHFAQMKDKIFQFNKSIIDATHKLVCAYKPNIAYYSAQGADGLKSLQETIRYIHAQYPDIPVILDAKRADIGNTSEMYAKEAFKTLEADAVTVNPYLGLDAIEPFLKYEDKGVIILCRTSNKGASDFQDLKVDNEALYIKVAKKIIEWDEKYGNCLMVVGATWPHQLVTLRTLAPNMFFLVPGIGAQGGDLKATLQAGLRQDKSGLIISLSRGIIYAADPKQEALKVRKEINKYRI